MDHQKKRYQRFSFDISALYPTWHVLFHCINHTASVTIDLQINIFHAKSATSLQMIEDRTLKFRSCINPVIQQHNNTNKRHSYIRLYHSYCCYIGVLVHSRVKYLNTSSADFLLNRWVTSADRFWPFKPQKLNFLILHSQHVASFWLQRWTLAHVFSRSHRAEVSRETGHFSQEAKFN